MKAQAATEKKREIACREAALVEARAKHAAQVKARQAKAQATRQKAAQMHRASAQTNGQAEVARKQAEQMARNKENKEHAELLTSHAELQSAHAELLDKSVVLQEALEEGQAALEREREMRQAADDKQVCAQEVLAAKDKVLAVRDAQLAARNAQLAVQGAQLAEAVEEQSRLTDALAAAAGAENDAEAETTEGEAAARSSSLAATHLLSSVPELPRTLADSKGTLFLSGASLGTGGFGEVCAVVAITEAVRDLHKIAVGQVVSSYEAHTAITKMADTLVKNAFDSEVAQKLAVKKVSTSFAYDDEKRIINELGKVAQQKQLAPSPYIIECVAANDPEQLLFFELAVGCLDDLLWQETGDGIKMPRDMDTWTVLFLGQQILDGVSYLHMCDINHRDIKPANILLMHLRSEIESMSIGEMVAQPAVKIADFGLSVLCGPDAPDVVAGAGTLPYMAPEALSGDILEFPKAADTWACGITITEMMQGGSIFAGHLPGDDTEACAEADAETIDVIMRWGCGNPDSAFMHSERAPKEAPYGDCDGKLCSIVYDLTQPDADVRMPAGTARDLMRSQHEALLQELASKEVPEPVV